MKSLRDLVLAFLTALRAFVDRRMRAARAPRPVRGPAHPWVYAAGAAAASAPPAPSDATAPCAPARPTRPSLPPHLAALLARAPDVEPEFVRLPAFVRSVPARVRIYNPRPPAPDAPRRPAFTAVSFAQRIARAVDPITAWLVHASPGRRVRA